MKTEPTAPAPTINQELVDFLDSGQGWIISNGQVAQTISFGFPTTPTFAAGFGEQAGWSIFSSAQRDVARDAISLWDDLVAADFVEAAGNSADIKFSNTTTDIGYAHGYFPGVVGDETSIYGKIHGSIWLNPTYASGTNDLVTPERGDWGFGTYIHEIGHALGLDHAGNYNGGTPQYGNASTGWIFTEDTQQYTIMSYFDADNTGASWGYENAQTPMLYDVLAIQQLYGADTTTRAGDTVYGHNSTEVGGVFDFATNTAPILTIWDSEGTDTLDVSNYRSDQAINLNAGAFSNVGGLTSNIAIAFGATIENAASGAGDDAILGNAADNTLSGGAGKDVLAGAAGNDVLLGGSSNDTLYGGAGDDALAGGAHKDWLWGGDGADTLDGGSGDDYLYGEDGDDHLIGNSGIDRIWGGEGRDLIESGSGDDKIYADAGDDTIIGGSGFDTLDYSAFSSAIVVDLHAHTVMGMQTGTDVVWGIEAIRGTGGDDTFKGDLRANDFRGDDGNDWFRGLGGADTFKGGPGSDTYVWAEKDIVEDGVHSGTDTILDFSVGQDFLDLRDVVVIGAGATLADYVQFTDTHAGALLQAKISTGAFVDVAVLAGLYEIDPSALIDAGTVFA